MAIPGMVPLGRSHTPLPARTNAGPVSAFDSSAVGLRAGPAKLT